MFNICIFAGTTEGRRLVDFLKNQPVKVTASVATEYGEVLLSKGENVTILSGRMDEAAMDKLFSEEKFDLVIDSTHPYAGVVTETISESCHRTGTSYMRLLRGASILSDRAVYVADTDAAAAFLDTVSGNVLLTTGSKELHKFAGIKDFSERVYARVLPMDESLAACRNAGVQLSHIIAMQGPFSEELNSQMLILSNAEYLVTKDGGDAGGFAAKVKAAEKAGVKLVIIGRPPQVEGKSFSEIIDLLCRDFGCSRNPEVSVVGIGPGNNDSLTARAKKALSEAECIIGASRMVDAVIAEGQGRFEAVAPEKIAGCINDAKEYQRFAVVMSGDTGFHSGTKKLLPLLKDCHTEVLPGISSLSYLCSKTGLSYEDMAIVSLHGKTGNLASEVRRHGKVFALVGGESGIKDMCARLSDAGLGDVTVYVGERLSYPDETITEGKAADLKDKDFHSLSAAIINYTGPKAPMTQGLPDEAFTRGESEKGVVPMTKSEVRCISLSKLALPEDAICYDVGAGTGSVSIEMALAASKGSVYAIEKVHGAAELIKTNCINFGINNLTVIEGSAPEALKELPAPTHVFIGGSSGNMKDIISCLLAKNPQVRIVAAAITLESVAELTECIKSFGFKNHSVVSVTVATDRKAGPYHLMTGNNPVYVFTMENCEVSQ
ncbi:MAG: precorrin-6A reductase [Parasporobacterium sp.]|nr:precorrin-6A reductase [Parasporobacterium sp.]